MRTILKLSAAAVLLAATPAFAEGVLVIDVSRVLGESAAGKSGTAQLKAKYDAQIAQRNQTFNTAAQSYQTQVNSARAAAKPGTQPPAATITAVNQAGERAQQAQEQLQQLAQEVQNSESFVRSQIVERMGPIAEQVRAERKADAVVPKGSVFAADPSKDVTAVVIQRLDAAFPTPSITPPQQAAAAPAAAPTQQPTQGR
ncbi:OmpH family outer membrane protein [uncultured Sphingomonas sp.]|uniref:OmpH family outer membrane protein n=1 Tax=uncultured Sphingomonas sp. TaxID=158754 RepID=UPI0025F1174C|nr:OmpH family outer membrane protein [uncultured Sphingomonas sp.]